MRISCIACDSGQTTRLGKLPIFTLDYLGAPLDSTTDAGSMYRCSNCSLLFRWPMPQPHELLSYYEGLNKDEWWKPESEREVWGQIQKQLANLPAASILDVGCFRGNMLQRIGGGLSCFGVEPSPSAGREAESRGVEIIGNSIDSLRAEKRRFGAITLIDVAEHLPRPLEAFRLLCDLLVTGGKLIVFTGSTDSASWRFAGQDYWYCGMPEHVAFFRPSWFDWAAAKINLRVTATERLSYQPGVFRVRADEALKNVAFVAYRRGKQLPVVSALISRLPYINRIENWQSCWWTSARDHILVTMTKVS